MSFADVVTCSEPRPGEVLDALEEDLTERRIDPIGISDPVETLSEQRDLANDRLDHYLRNLSKSEGARKVAEEFYAETHGEDIDASDVDALRNKIPDVDSIIHGEALPAVSKEDLRDKYGVSGSWLTADGAPHLSPRWVQERDDEPYIIDRTGGTTGVPWYRPMTRNDCAVLIARVIDSLAQVLDDVGRRFAGINIVFPESNIAWSYEDDASIHRYISEFTEAGVKIIDFTNIKPGEDKLADEFIEYLNKNEFTMVFGPVTVLLDGKIGVHLRRGNVDLDVAVNAGRPLSKTESEVLEDQGIPVYDVFAETEYPQRTNLHRSFQDVSGFSLPLTSQVNLVQTDSGDLVQEGTGRFSYFSFGIEGQIVPGVYVSGVEGTLHKPDDSTQLLEDVQRVSETERGC